MSTNHNHLEHLGYRASSEMLMELHVYTMPPDLWREHLHSAISQIVGDTVSAGFIRVYPEMYLHELREQISKQIGFEVVPRNFVFLRSIGRCFTTVNARQEQELKAKHFMPPTAHLPEIYVLDAIAANRSTNSSSYVSEADDELERLQLAAELLRRRREEEEERRRRMLLEEEERQRRLAKETVSTVKVRFESLSGKSRQTLLKEAEEALERQRRLKDQAEERRLLRTREAESEAERRAEEEVHRRQKILEDQERFRQRLDEEGLQLQRQREEEEEKERERLRHLEEERETRERERNRLLEEMDRERERKRTREEEAAERERRRLEDEKAAQERERARLLREKEALVLDQQRRREMELEIERLRRAHQELEERRDVTEIIQRVPLIDPNEKMRIEAELERLRLRRFEMDKLQLELMKRARFLQTKHYNSKNKSRDKWKRMYFEEKKKTIPVEETSAKLLQELDSLHRKIEAQLEIIQNSERHSDSVSSQLALKIEATKNEHIIEELHVRLQNVKMRLTVEMKLRYQSECELHALRTDLAQRKINVMTTRSKFYEGYNYEAIPTSRYLLPILTPHY